MYTCNLIATTHQSNSNVPMDNGVPSSRPFYIMGPICSSFVLVLENIRAKKKIKKKKEIPRNSILPRRGGRTREVSMLT